MLLGEAGPLPAAGVAGGGTTVSRGHLSRIICQERRGKRDYYHEPNILGMA